jgi:microcystin-dependent protein
MMARTAENRDDTSGLLAAGGTATAFTVTTFQGLATTPTDGQMIAFTASNTNGPGVTLQADGESAYPIDTAPSTPVSSGVLIAGTPYTVKYSASATAWILRDFYGNPYTVPIGAMLPYTGATSPNSNFVLPYGQCISRTTYATYFAQVSTTFGACDGTTTFGVPDMRGRTVAGLDNLGGSAASRLTTTYFGSDPTVLGDVGGSQNHTLTQAELSTALGTATSAVSGTISNPNGFTQGVFIGAGGGGAGTGTQTTNGISTAGITVSTSITNSSGGNAHAIVPPMIVLSYILRVL